jgi:hypothetical protein
MAIRLLSSESITGNFEVSGKVGIGTAPTSRNLSVFRDTAGSVANFLHYTDASNFAGLYIGVSQSSQTVSLNASGSSGGNFEMQCGNATVLSLNNSSATFAGKILVGTGATAAATINAYSTAVSTGLYSALRVIEHGSASSYWDIGATNAANTLLNFYHNGSTTPKIIFTHTGGATFLGDVGIGAAASDGNLHVRKTGINTGITNVLMNANFADASNGTGLSIGYRTDETTAVLAARTATGNIAFYSYDGGWSESMRIKNNGNVGIAMTPIAALDSTLQVSEIGQTITSGGDIAGKSATFAGTGGVTNSSIVTIVSTNTSVGAQQGGEIGFAGKYSTGSNQFAQFAKIMSYKKDTTSGNYGGGLQFWTRENGNPTAVKMTIDPGGNVGIGTSSPVGKLQVSLPTYTNEDTNSQQAIFGVDSGYGVRIGYNETDNKGYINVLKPGVAWGSLILQEDIGKVGIGEPSPPTLLSLKSFLANTSIVTLKCAKNDSSWTIGDRIGGINFFGEDGSGQGAGIKGSINYIVTSSSGGSNAMTFNVAGTANNQERMRIDSSGNVGIGISPVSGARLTLGTGGVANEIISFAPASGGNAELRNTSSTGTFTFTNSDGSSEKMRITSGGKTLIGITSEQNAGHLQMQSGTSENGGILDIAGGGWYRYYTRVCRNATTLQAAGYWHIKTNIVVNSDIMFMAKFYGYIYGSAQIVELIHAGYAYSGTNTVINQATTNNGSEPNANSVIYSSSNGNKVTFRIAFGTGNNFSTYFAGLMMDMALPNPTGQGHDFEIEAQSFSTSGSYY